MPLHVGRIDHDDAIASGAFSTVERAVGALDDVAMVGAALGNHRGDADAHRDDPAWRGLVGDREEVHRRAQALRYFRHAACLGVRDYDREFFTPVTGEAVGCADDAGLARARDLLQTCVALWVTVGIVVTLERVDVEEGNRDRFFRADRARPLAFERGVERAPVRHAGQGVDHREFLEVTGTLAQRGLLECEREISGERIAQREPVFVVHVASRRHPDRAADPAVVVQRRIGAIEVDARHAVGEHRASDRIVDDVFARGETRTRTPPADRAATRIRQRQRDFGGVGGEEQPRTDRVEDGFQRFVAVDQVGRFAQYFANGLTPRIRPRLKHEPPCVRSARPHTVGRSADTWGRSRYIKRSGTMGKSRTRRPAAW